MPLQPNPCHNSQDPRLEIPADGNPFIRAKHRAQKALQEVIEESAGDFHGAIVILTEEIVHAVKQHDGVESALAYLEFVRHTLLEPDA